MIEKTADRLDRIAEGIAQVEAHLSSLLSDPQLMRTLSSAAGPGTRAVVSLRHIVNSPAMLAGLSAQIAEIARLLNGPQEGVGHRDGGL